MNDEQDVLSLLAAVNASFIEQAMLIAFEDQARWRIKNKLTEDTEVPNYLDYIYMDALEEVKSGAIGIIH